MKSLIDACIRPRGVRAAVALLCAQLAALPVQGCGDRAELWESSRTVLGPVPLGDRVAYVDSLRARVVILDASADTPRALTFAVGARPVFAAPVGERLAVVTRGQEALYQGEHDEPPGLYLVDPTQPDAAPVRYELDSPFDRLAVAADESLLVAYFSDGGAHDDGLFWNPNEVAIIDLEAEPSTANPVFRTIRSFSSAPTGVVLAPPLVIPGDPSGVARTLAFVLAPGTVTILDASHPDKREVSIRLALEDAADVVPQQVIFAPEAGAAYLRASGAGDVLSILLSYEAPAPEDALDNDFQPALTELGAGGTPADLDVWDDATVGRRRAIAATPTTGEVTIIDTDTAEFTSISVGDPIDRVLLLPDQGTRPPEVAVLASIASRTPRIHVLDLSTVGEATVPVSVRTIELAEPVYDVVPIPCGEKVLIVHDDTRTVMGLLDVRDGSVMPIEGVGRLDSYDITSCGEFLVGSTAAVERVGVVDLETAHPTYVRLDDAPAFVFALPSHKILIDHDDPAGRATLLPRPDATRDEAVVFSGFLVAGILDERL